MSLDVYLESDHAQPRSESSGIFIREDGQMKEISREEWDRRFPDRTPIVCNRFEEKNNEVYWRNITHNLIEMAKAADLYIPVWKPENIGITHASMLIEPLANGLQKLKAEPKKFKAYNPSNGWGSYEGLIAFVSDYLNACIRHPEARVRVWR